MKSTKHRFKALLAGILSLCPALAAIAAEAAPLVVDGSQTTLDKARNDVPVINIASPSESGLSHNKFKQYNVGTEGLILNNATAPVDTQLGGYIYGNENLTGSASVILNEVTSAQRTTLGGYTEIAGPAADLVIANPNGLTINGAGFINTSNITLTTGVPQMNNGALDSLKISGGDISIEGAGLNSQSQQSTRIYSRYLQLNARINADNLDLKLGSNTLNSAGQVINPSTPSPLQPQSETLLLDSSALGGMYANRISLVGTGEGLGVNLPPEVLASTGEITITSDGTVMLQQMSAAQNISVSANSGIAIDNNIHSGRELQFGTTNGALVNNGILTAADKIDIAAPAVDNRAQITAGLNDDKTLNDTGIITINSADINNEGTLQSTDNTAINTALLTNKGDIIANNRLDVVATGTVTNSGLLHANQNSQITTGQLNNSSDITASQALDIQTTTLTSSGGELSGNTVKITASDQIDSNDTDILAVENINLAIIV